MKKNSLKALGFTLLFVTGFTLYGQEPDQKKSSFFQNIPYFFDDFFVTAGLNYGGIYMTKYKDEVSYSPGFQLGLEHYRSIGRILFLNYGLHYSQKNFQHNINNVDFTIHNLEGLLFISYELPEFREFDFRFLVGTHYNYYLNFSKKGDYLAEQQGDNDVFKYDTADMKRLDYGMFFGISFERGNYYLRLSSTVGLNNLQKNDQGMYHGFQINFGYFFFRNLRNK